MQFRQCSIQQQQFWQHWTATLCVFHRRLHPRESFFPNMPAAAAAAVPLVSCRACYGVLRFVMESGAKGCEVRGLLCIYHCCQSQGACVVAASLSPLAAGHPSEAICSKHAARSSGAAWQTQLVCRAHSWSPHTQREQYQQQQHVWHAASGTDGLLLTAFSSLPLLTRRSLFPASCAPSVRRA